ncbi:MAG: hypothetical protein JWL98_936, partial [Xanthomonadaceae bacterium]|nr:hypothetical protein [Xanthomonadaceae bacterium]
MSLRGWMWLGLLLATAGWWYSPLSPRVPEFAVAAPGTRASCPAPPGILDTKTPLQ